LYVVDGQAIKLVPCSQKIGTVQPVLTRKSYQRRGSDLAGEVFFADLVPEENRPSRQYYDNGTSRRFNWILSGKFTTPGAEPCVVNGDRVRVVLAETRLNTLHGGVVRAPKLLTGGREKLKLSLPWF